MSEPTKQWSIGEQMFASDFNTTFAEVLNQYKDFTYGETIAVNNALYFHTDGKVYKTDADDATKVYFVGFAKEAGVLNDVKKVQIAGIVSGLAGLSIRSTYYLSGTAGAVSTSEGTYRYMVGAALSATTLFIRNSLKIHIVSPTLNMPAIDGTADTTITLPFRHRWIRIEGYGAISDSLGSNTGRAFAYANFSDTTLIKTHELIESSPFIWRNETTKALNIYALGGTSRSDLYITVNSITDTTAVIRVHNVLITGSGSTNSQGYNVTITFYAD